MRDDRTARLTPPLIQLLAILLATSHLGAAALAAQDGPSRPGIDIEAYRFELTLRDDTDEIAGRATVTLRFTADGVTDVPLDLIGRGDDSGEAPAPGMQVSAVASADGGRQLAFSHEDDLLTVRLPEPGRAGALATFTVDYGGIPASGLRIGPNKYGSAPSSATTGRIARATGCRRWIISATRRPTSS